MLLGCRAGLDMVDLDMVDPGLLGIGELDCS
jgi:hypothetical protein